MALERRTSRKIPRRTMKLLGRDKEQCPAHKRIGYTSATAPAAML
jgi:hypothetical protein